MKNLTLTFIKSISTVIVLMLLFSACASDRSLTRNDDFYNRRIVDKKDHIDYSKRDLHRHFSKGTLLKTNQNEIALPKKETSSLAALAEARTKSTPSTIDIASIGSKQFVNPVHQKLSKRIDNLYKSSTDLKSFRKGFIGIQKEQVKRFMKANQNDDPKVEKTPSTSKPAFSIASFVLGIVGLFVGAVICGTLAVIFGAIGLKKGMKGLAIAGIVIGVVDIVLGIIILAG
jgi:PBP1b-binding outer membrane lipoprotein LpoB